MLDVIISKTMQKDKGSDQQKKKKWDTEWSKASWKHINRNPKSFLETTPAQKEVSPPQKLQDLAYE